MKASRELDALIAKKIMGWTNLGPISNEIGWSTDGTNFGHHPKGIYDYIPFYSSDIAKAWEVVEKTMMFMGIGSITQFSDGWEVTTEGSEGLVQEFGKTAPEAICLAALKTLEEEEEEFIPRSGAV